MFALLRPAIQCTESTSLPKYRTKTRYARHEAVATIKRATSFFNKRSGTQFYHKDHTNSKRFPGFPDTLTKQPNWTRSQIFTIFSAINQQNRTETVINRQTDSKLWNLLIKNNLYVGMPVDTS